jgi:HAD superfamily hydrolase (TIGR01509 family)
MSKTGPGAETAAIFFDFDGTLIDSFPDHLQAYQVALAPYGIQLTADAYFAAYSPHWYYTYEVLGLPREVWAEVDEAWLVAAAEHESALFAGVPQILDELGKQAVLGIVSAGSRSRVLSDLQRTGIAGCFQVVVAGDDVQRPKPDPQGLLLALAEAGIPAERALYVGDAREDCAMAQAAGVPFVGVAAQFATVRLASECMTISTIGELPRYVAGRGGGARR